jgi:hypothetical protein
MAAIETEITTRLAGQIGTMMPVQIERESLRKPDKPVLPNLSSLHNELRRTIEKWHAQIPNFEACMKTFGRMEASYTEVQGVIMEDRQLENSLLTYARVALLCETLEKMIISDSSL